MNGSAPCISLLICWLFLAFELCANSIPNLRIQGIEHPTVSLNGTWKINLDPPNDFWNLENDTASWADIKVPGEAAMQGFYIEHDQPFAYQKTIPIPADFAGNRIFLRFDGVYSHARLWVNGHFVRNHKGGFTRWDAEITQYVKAGQNARISLEVTDRMDEISFAAGYAKHPIGGILRDVHLYVLPQSHLGHMAIETDFNETYTDATLKISAATHIEEMSELHFQLTDPQGRPVPLEPNHVKLRPEQPRFEIAIPVINPQQWDAEHPNLYTLTTTLQRAEQPAYSLQHRIGFREIRIEGSRLLVNGRPVKLRGACRHDIHPLLGRVSTADYARKDVELAKEANMNFLRTSHYPPTEAFLEACDEIGIYVECESAVCFVHDRKGIYGRNKMGHSQNDPAHTEQYMSQAKEMVTAYRNHASVLIWSIANESHWGENMRKSGQWIKEADPTRPRIYSRSYFVPDELDEFADILSLHYPDPTGYKNGRDLLIARNFEAGEKPLLFDEWGHVLVTPAETDPAVRDFLGQSLDRYWTGAFEAEGALGGAIWAMIDETFFLPATIREANPGNSYQLRKHGNHPVAGYGCWGIMDVWRRKKPEFWNTKKAYSPVRLLDTTPSFTANERLRLPVHNRFNHSSLRKVNLEYSINNESMLHLDGPPIPPMQKGEIELPAHAWKEGDQIHLRFTRADRVIDEYLLTLGTPERCPPPRLRPSQTAPLKVEENEEILTITGPDFLIPISKQTGLITRARRKDRVVIETGPHLNLKMGTVRQPTTPLNDVRVEWEKTNTLVIVRVEGSMKHSRLAYAFTIAPDATIELDFKAELDPNDFGEKERQKKLADGVSRFYIDHLLTQAGIDLLLPGTYTHLAWTNRKAYWSTYPTNHIGARTGSTPLYSPSPPVYRTEPITSWQDSDDIAFYRDRPGLTPQARSTKAYTDTYTLAHNAALENSITLRAQEQSIACQLEQHRPGKLRLHVSSLWDFPEIRWNNYIKNIAFPQQLDLQVKLEL